MPQARPSNEVANYIALGRQSAKDTESTNFYYFKHLSGSNFAIEADIVTEREGGDGQEQSFRFKQRIKSGGQIVANARPDVAGRLLFWALGADTAATSAIATTSNALVDHTITPAASQPYLTGEQNWADVTERVDNVMVSQLDIDFQAGQPVKLTAQLMAGGTVYERTSQLTPAREAQLPFTYPGASIVLTAAGTTFAKLTKAKISIKRGIDDQIQTTGLNTEDLVNLTMDVDVDATVKYEDQTVYRQIHYGGGTQVPINLATGSLQLTMIDPDGSSQMLQLTKPFMQFTAAKVQSIMDPDAKTLYLDVTAQNVKSGTAALVALVRNTVATAYTSW